VLDAPSVSDARYDALFRQLTARESAHPKLSTRALIEPLVDTGLVRDVADLFALTAKRAEPTHFTKSQIALGVSAQSARASVLDGPLRGLSFCVTGTLSEPREVIHAKIQALGGGIYSAINEGTHYLITEEQVEKAKIENAQERGA
jgi:NAD-dependent DNA ligase